VPLAVVAAPLGRLAFLVVFSSAQAVVGVVVVGAPVALFGLALGAADR